jgi:hypothetical protein
MLSGKKTYIVAAALFVLGGLKAVGIIDQAIYDALFAVLAAAGAASIRAAIK